MTYFRVNENFYGFQFVVFCGNGVVSRRSLKILFPCRSVNALQVYFFQ